MGWSPLFCVLDPRQTSRPLPRHAYEGSAFAHGPEEMAPASPSLRIGCGSGGSGDEQQPSQCPRNCGVRLAWKAAKPSA